MDAFESWNRKRSWLSLFLGLVVVHLLEISWNLVKTDVHLLKLVVEVECSFELVDLVRQLPYLNQHVWELLDNFPHLFHFLLYFFHWYLLLRGLLRLNSSWRSIKQNGRHVGIEFSCHNTSELLYLLWNLGLLLLKVVSNLLFFLLARFHVEKKYNWP